MEKPTTVCASKKFKLFTSPNKNDLLFNDGYAGHKVGRTTTRTVTIYGES
jgi:hypothetical protein